MSTRALAATPELVEDSDTYISSSQTFGVKAVLPVIDAGANLTVAVGVEMRFETTGSGYIEIVDSDGHRVGILPGRSRALVVALTGNDQTGDPPQAWFFEIMSSPPAATVVDVPGTATADAEVDAAVDNAVNAAVDANASLSVNASFNNAEIEAANDLLAAKYNATAVIVNANAVKQNAAAVKQNANAVKQDLIADDAILLTLRVNEIIAILDGAGLSKTE